MQSLKEMNETTLFAYVDQLFKKIDDVPSVEAAAQTLAKSMYDTFKHDGRSELVLSRVFHSFEYRALPQDIQEAAKAAIGKTPDSQSVFLTLLGTYGDEPTWCDRKISAGHKAIPLLRESVKKFPMAMLLLQQIGFDLGIILGEKLSGVTVSGIERSYGVFYVGNAKGSPYIPAQDFVTRYGIKTVLGSGVRLPTNDISVYIGFSRIDIDEIQALRISSLMPLFWQKTFPILERGFF